MTPGSQSRSRFRAFQKPEATGRHRGALKRPEMGEMGEMDTLQEINISHLGKRKIIFKYALSGGYVNSLEGNLNPIFFPEVLGSKAGIYIKYSLITHSHSLF